MWFVFPQIAGLGSSPTARRFAISSIGEARAYLAHPVLGPRLIESTRALLDHTDQTAETMLGGIDAMKLRSSLTLFGLADPDEPVFERALAAFFGAEPDQLTVDLAKRLGA